jgi:terminase small subunit-like protein
MGKPRTIRTDRVRATFLAILAEQCNVTEACRAAGIGRSAVYTWRDDDPAFRAAWEEAEQMAADRLEKVAWERASKGLSDRMLELLLKAHRPEKFKERVANEHTGANGGPIQHEQVNSDADDFQRRVARLAAREAPRDRAGETQH